MRHLPNIITLCRIACVPIFIAVMWNEDFYAAFYLMCIMSISDGVDGFLAKYFYWQSRLGELLDPLADKLLLITAFIMLYQLSIFPLWLLAIVLCRDAMIVAGYFILRYLYGETKFCPHWTGKVTTFLQFIIILTVLINQFSPLPNIVVPLLTNCVAVASVISGIIYFMIGWNMRISASRKYTL